MGRTKPTGDTEDMAELRARLREAEQTLDAIRNGEVDAVVIGGPAGQQVYTLENADRPYRVLIEQMQEGAITLGEDGTVLYCNRRFSSLVATPHERIVGRPIDQYLSPAENRLFHHLLAGAGPSGEFTLISAAGTAVPVNISLVDLAVDEGSPRVVCGVVTDLTNSRQRSHELAAANAKLASEIEERERAESSLQLALDAAGMGSWDLDLASGLIRRSLRHDRIFGHSGLLPSWTLDTTLAHVHADDRETLAVAFAEAGAAGAIELELRIHADGNIRWVHIKGRTYYDGRQPIRVAGVVADVTDQRAIEEQLRQAQKMEAVGQLTGGIAHDFNNLLMTIGGSLELLNRRLPQDARSARLFDAARQGVARGARLNQQLLAFSRRQALQIEAVCVDDLIPTFEHLLDRSVGETVSVEIARADEIWFCRTDPHQLETAILNLAINARDAMPEGGTLTLATANRSIPHAVAAPWGGVAGDYVVVSVADSGVGMSQETLSHAFEPFFTTKAVGRGTGLGLSQVYGFAKQSEGFVTIASELGRGTTVSIHLPRTAAPAAPRAEVDAASPEIHGQGAVLVVEDDGDVRATARMMLHDLGYRVSEAETGHRALALLEQGELVDLVFSDIVMPDGMNGIELAKEIERRWPGLPILLTSGYTAQRLFPDAPTETLTILRKPYTLSDLSRAVQGALPTRPMEGSPGRPQ